MDTSSTNVQNPGHELKVLWHLSNEFHMGHSLAGLLWESHSRKFYWNLDGKIPNWECFFAHRKQGFFLSIYVDDIKMAGEKQNVAPTWKKLMKNVELDEPTSFLDHEDLGCTQREWKNATNVEQFSKMFESRVSLLEQPKSYQGGKSLTQRKWLDLTTWKDMLENALSETVNWQTRKWSNFSKCQGPCLDDQHFKQELESIWELSQVCSPFVLKCLYMARLGFEDQTFYGLSTNLQEQWLNGLRHVTDDWQDWFHTFTSQVTTDNIVMWVTRRSIVEWGLFQDSDFSGNLENSKSTSGRVLCIFESRTFVPVSCMCKNRLLSRTVLHSLRSFLWMLDYAWMEYLLSIFGTWQLTCYVQKTTLQDKVTSPKREVEQVSKCGLCER